jgi:DNA-binding GntR family transcriptional regulator
LHSINTADFEDICRLRALLEEHIAKHARDHMTPARLAAPAETLAEFERMIARGNAFDVYSTQSKFHLVMLPTATAWDRQLSNQLWVASERDMQLYVGAQRQPDVADSIVASHRSLLDVGHGRDDEAIRRAVVGHIEYSLGAIAPTVRADAGR